MGKPGFGEGAPTMPDVGCMAGGGMASGCGLCGCGGGDGAKCSAWWCLLKRIAQENYIKIERFHGIADLW